MVFLQCEGGAGVISGVHSYHDNGKEDRRWKYNCCFVDGYCYDGCQWTGYENEYDEYMDYTVTEGYYITGVKSKHDNGKEDRVWQYKECKLVKCSDLPPAEE